MTSSMIFPQRRPARVAVAGVVLLVALGHAVAQDNEPTVFWKRLDIALVALTMALGG